MSSYDVGSVDSACAGDFVHLCGSEAEKLRHIETQRYIHTWNLMTTGYLCLSFLSNFPQVEYIFTSAYLTSIINENICTNYLFSLYLLPLHSSFSLSFILTEWTHLLYNAYRAYYITMELRGAWLKKKDSLFYFSLAFHLPLKLYAIRKQYNPIPKPKTFSTLTLTLRCL